MPKLFLNRTTENSHCLTVWAYLITTNSCIFRQTHPLIFKEIHMSAKIYMQFNDIKGDAAEQNHTNWIRLHNCSFGVSRYVSQESNSEKREIGNASVSSLQIIKTMDISSQKILSEAFGGFGADVCTIHFVGENGTYLEYKLTNAVISSYDVNHIEGNYSPTESIRINFTRIETKYITEENGGSSICAGYDIPTAKNL